MEYAGDLELRRSGGRPSDEELKARFEKNKTRHMKDLSIIEKGWVSKLDLAGALLLELEEINKRQIANGLKPISGTHVSKLSLITLNQI